MTGVSGKRPQAKGRKFTIIQYLADLCHFWLAGAKIFVLLLPECKCA